MRCSSTSNTAKAGVSPKRRSRRHRKTKVSRSLVPPVGDSHTGVACTAYTRYVLDIGMSQDWIGLQVALLPCLLGYGVLAERLYKDPNSKRTGNPYWTWIENYVAPDYIQAVKTGRGMSSRLGEIFTVCADSRKRSLKGMLCCKVPSG